LAAFDLAVNQWVPSIRLDWVTLIAIGISYAFDTYSLFIACLAFAGYLFYKKCRLQSLLLMGAMSAGAVFVEVFKLLSGSLRPVNGLITVLGYSFPSGHTVGCIVFCGLLAYFAWYRWKSPRCRAFLSVLVIAISLMVGFDRLYLNVHWFSDVLGGYLFGLFWLFFSIFLFKLLNIAKIHAKMRYMFQQKSK
jgi:undecaprenyl-diphosphatase